MTLATILGVCLLVSPSFGMTSALEITLSPTAALQQNSTPSNPTQSGADNSPAQPQEKVPALAPQAVKPAKPNSGATAQKAQQTKPKTSTPAPAKKKRRKSAAKPAQPDPPPKTVVKNGGTTDPAVRLSPGLTDQQVTNQRQDITQLLANTDENLKKSSGHALNASQQDMVKQILQYVEQAKTAGNAGDLDRARTLAFKARLLSEELNKP